MRTVSITRNKSTRSSKLPWKGNSNTKARNLFFVPQSLRRTVASSLVVFRHFKRRQTPRPRLHRHQTGFSPFSVHLYHVYGNVTPQFPYRPLPPLYACCICRPSTLNIHLQLQGTSPIITTLSRIMTAVECLESMDKVYKHPFPVTYELYVHFYHSKILQQHHRKQRKIIQN